MSASAGVRAAADEPVVTPAADPDCELLKRLYDVALACLSAAVDAVVRVFGAAPVVKRASARPRPRDAVSCGAVRVRATSTPQTPCQRRAHSALCESGTLATRRRCRRRRSCG